MWAFMIFSEREYNPLHQMSKCRERDFILLDSLKYRAIKEKAIKIFEYEFNFWKYLNNYGVITINA